MENTKKLYKTADKWNDKQQYKAILEVAMVSTPEGCNTNSTMSPNQSESTKNPNARKNLRQFSETMDVKHNNDVRRLGAYKEKRKAIRAGNSLW